ncbi:MAG: NAD(P)-dependent oxidoreductase [Acidimicrobiia bacterium]|nr:NAD(P)-dependent oxidoreductase [Acidimicrobiia bacterium]
MIIVDEALQQREAARNPVRVALSGAGFAAQGLILQLTRPTPGIRLSVIANRTMATIEQVLAHLEIVDYITVDDEDGLQAAIADDRLAVTTDPLLAASTPGTDVLVDATGEVEHAARVVLAGIEARKHIVLVNAELDATLGPILKTKADAAGVILTDMDGDQPAVLMNLMRQVKTLGFRPVLLGNIKSLLDYYRTPETQAEFARKVWQRPKMITSFADGSKIAFEMATLANGTGFGVMTRGMYGPRCDRVEEAPDHFDHDKLINGPGYVDYILGAEPSFGVFVLGFNDEKWMQRYMKVYKMGEGPLYTFYVPSHLGPLETPVTIARAALFGDAATTPLGAPVTDVVGYAKRDLQSGDTLDGIGGFTVYGIMENSPAARAEDLVPEGLTDQCTVVRPVSKDQPLTMADIEPPVGSVGWSLWREQCTRQNWEVQVPP